jgi:hypothetical protein
MVAINPPNSMIILNVDGLNAPVKTLQVAHICNTSYLRGRDQEDCSLRSEGGFRPLSTKKLRIVVHITWEVLSRRIVIHVGLCVTKNEGTKGWLKWQSAC